jgi:ABC-type multidrug transport system ATPase subunit
VTSFCILTVNFLLMHLYTHFLPRSLNILTYCSLPGKTSLLNILAGRVARSNRAVVVDATTNIQLDGARVDPRTNLSVRRKIAFVEQHDTLHVSATPREAIRFSARLRLPRSTTQERVEVLTESMVQALGLQDCADTVIGAGDTSENKGISGGERKRTAIAVELVTQPTLVFLDECTSGLDSFSALNLIEILNKLASQGASILLTLHQPSSDILDRLDRIILLRGGRVMYQGSTEAVTDYFAAHSHPLPARYNPADWCLFIAQTVTGTTLEELGYFPPNAEAMVQYERQDRERNLPWVDGSGDYSADVENQGASNARVEEAAVAVGGKKAMPSGAGRENHRAKNDADRHEYHHEHVSMAVQIACLIRRDFHGMHRNKIVLGARAVLTTFMSLLVGSIFWQIGDGDKADPSVRTISSLLLLVFAQSRSCLIHNFGTLL